MFSEETIASAGRSGWRFSRACAEAEAGPPRTAVETSGARSNAADLGVQSSGLGRAALVFGAAFARSFCTIDDGAPRHTSIAEWVGVGAGLDAPRKKNIR